MMARINVIGTLLDDGAKHFFCPFNLTRFPGIQCSIEFLLDLIGNRRISKDPVLSPYFYQLHSVFLY